MLRLYMACVYAYSLSKSVRTSLLFSSSTFYYYYYCYFFILSPWMIFSPSIISWSLFITEDEEFEELQTHYEKIGLDPLNTIIVFDSFCTIIGLDPLYIIIAFDPF